VSVRHDCGGRCLSDGEGATCHGARLRRCGGQALLGLGLALLLVGLAYQFMPSQRVSVGSREGLPRLSGFYWLETGPGNVPFRWCGPDGSVRFWGIGNSALELRLFYQAMRPSGLATVAIAVNGHTIASGAVGGAFELHRYAVPRQAVGLVGPVRVSVISEPFSAPPDTRALGAGVSWVELAPAGRPVVPPVCVVLPVLLSVAGLLAIAPLWPSSILITLAQVPALLVAAIIVREPGRLGPWLWALPATTWLLALVLFQGRRAADMARPVARLVLESQPPIWGLAVMLTLASLVFLITALVRFHVDVPFWDEWSLVPLLNKLYAGRLTFRDLIAQHNEHRPFFGRVIALALIRVTHWDTRYGVVLNLLIALATYVTLLLQLARTRLQGAPLRLAWVLPGLALLSFSLSQWENWLWDWQVLFFLHVFAVVLGLILLAGGEGSWWRVGAACLLGVVAVYTVASGMLYWLLGLPLVLTQRFPKRRERLLATGLWVLSAGLSIGYFLIGYHRTAGNPGPGYALSHLGYYLRYVTLYLATPVNAFGRSAGVAVGAIGLVLFCGLAAYLLLGARLRLRLLAPYLLLGLYSLGCAAAAGTGRLALGLVQASASRYATFSYFLWLADLVFLALSLGHLYSRASRPEALAYVGAFLMVAITTAAAVASWRGLDGCHWWYDRLAPERPALVQLRGDDESLANLYPDANLLRQRGLVLKELRLSVFRDQWQ